jgi:DNA-binding response OmpR family regulator
MKDVPTVLVVEDDRDIRDVLRRYLERAEYAVLTTGSGAEALRLLVLSRVDLVLLDLGLPDVDGTDVLVAARTAVDPVPVIVLSARSTVPDRIRGLTLGADDYVVKPFSPAEVVLRVRAVLARGAAADADDVTTFGGGRLQIDQPAHRARIDGADLDLTPTEWGLLTTLAGSPSRVFSRLELVNRVRGYEFSGYERSVDSHVKNLRHKLGDDGRDVIATVLGVGYRFGWARDA